MALQTIHIIDLGVVPYGQALALQYSLRQQLVDEPEVERRIGYLITLQHPLTVTLGKRGTPEALLFRNVLKSNGCEVFKIDRGGEATLHNPGQLVVYPILKLEDYDLGVVDLVRKTAYAVSDAMASYGISSHYDEELPGLWAELSPEAMSLANYIGLRRRKLASVGMRISKGTSTHGLAVNVINDMVPFSWIAACGLENPPMAKVYDFVREIEYEAFKEKVVSCWLEKFHLKGVEGDVSLPVKSEWVKGMKDW